MRTTLTVCLLLCATALPCAAQPSPNPWLGVYEGSGLRVSIVRKDGALGGTITFRKRTFALSAIEYSGGLRGRFSCAEGTFPFTAKREGDRITLSTGGKTYGLDRLEKVLRWIDVNPLGAKAATLPPHHYSYLKVGQKYHFRSVVLGPEAHIVEEITEITRDHIKYIYTATVEGQTSKPEERTWKISRHAELPELDQDIEKITAAGRTWLCWVEVVDRNKGIKAWEHRTKNGLRLYPRHVKVTRGGKVTIELTKIEEPAAKR